MKQFIKPAITIISAFIIVFMGTCAATYIAKTELRFLSKVEYANYCTIPYKIDIINAYEEYYNSVESYLDEIEEYTDINSGSDIQCNYLEAKQVLDSIKSLEY